MQRPASRTQVLANSRTLWSVFGLTMLLTPLAAGLLEASITPAVDSLRASIELGIGVTFALIGGFSSRRKPLRRFPPGTQPYDIAYLQFVLAMAFLVSASFMGAAGMFHGGGDPLYWLIPGPLALLIAMQLYPNHTSLQRMAGIGRFERRR